jgi:hypothetical protein
VSSKADPYCCVGSNGHIWHHCIHRSLDDVLEKARTTKFKLTDKQVKDILNILNGTNAKVDDA